MIAERICIDPAAPPDLGQTVFFKFTSFNLRQMQEENLANVPAYPYTITGQALGLLTPAHATYTPTSNPLTGHDAGSTATIFIAAFSMRIPGISDIPYDSGSITGLAYATLYYVYFDDPGFNGGAVVYEATTDKETALDGAGRFFVGSIETPQPGGADTPGNGDGGSGAQFGLLTVLQFAVQDNVILFSSNAVIANPQLAGNGAISNIQQGADGDQTTFADFTATADGTNNNSAEGFYTVPPGVLQRSTGATLKVLAEVPTNTVSGTPGDLVARIEIMKQDGTSLANLVNITNNGATLVKQVLAYDIPANLNFSQLVVNAFVQTSPSDASGGIEMQIYNCWIEVTQ